MKATAKAKIVEALIRLMKKQSIDSILVKDLIKEAGVNPSSYYYNFGAIDDVVDYIIADFTAQLRKTLALNSSVEYSTMSKIFDYIYENKEKYLSLYHSTHRSKLDEEMAKTIIEVNSKLDIFFEAPDGSYYMLTGRDEKLYVKVSALQEIAFIDWWADSYFERTPDEINTCDVGLYLLRYAFSKLKKEHFNDNKYPVLSLKEVTNIYNNKYLNEND